MKDGSAKEITYEKGYRVTSIIGLTEKTKHPLPFINEFHSETQPGYNSINEVTHNNLKGIINYLEDYTSVFVFDRGYDDNKIFDYMSKNNHKFVVRLDDERTLLFKGKRRSVENVAKSRKGKIVYKAWFENEEYDLTVSYTKQLTI